MRRSRTEPERVGPNNLMASMQAAGYLEWTNGKMTRI